MIPLAQPGFIRRADHRQHLLAGQIAEHRALETFYRDAQGTFDHLQRCHVPVRGELQERPQCRQAGIATAHGIVSLAFQMIEEGHDQLWRDVGQRHRGRRLAQARLGKVEEQHEAISVGGDGLRAERSLLGQILGEVGLHERGK